MINCDFITFYTQIIHILFYTQVIDSVKNKIICIIEEV